MRWYGLKRGENKIITRVSLLWIPPSANLSTHDVELSHQDTLRQLVKELKTAGLEPTRRDEILEQMQHLLKSSD